MKKEGMLYISIFILLIFGIVAISSQDIPSDYSDCEIYGVCKEEEVITFNNNTAFVNLTANWFTNIGILSGVNATQMENNNGILNILESWIRSIINSTGITTPTLQEVVDKNNSLTTNINSTANVTADWGFFNSINVSNNSIHIGGVRISSSDEGLNISNNVTSPFFVGDGSHLTNLSITEEELEEIMNSTLWDNLFTNNLFANFIGSITNRVTKIWASAFDVAGDLNQTNGNFTGNQIHAEMFIHNHPPIATPLITQDVYENVTGWTFDDLNGFSNSTNFTLIPQIAGLYSVNYAISSAGSGGANNEYSYVINVNGVEQHTTHSHRDSGTAQTIGSVSGTGLLRFAVGDVITFQIKNENGGGGVQDIDISSANVNFWRVGN